MIHSGEPVDDDALTVVRSHQAEITFLGFERVIVRCGCGGFCQRAAHGSSLLEGLQVKGDFVNFVVSKQLVEFTDTAAVGFPH